MAKIKLDDPLYDRVKRIADAGGYSSPEEFIVHIIERELEKLESEELGKVVEDRLRGLGYIE